MLEVALPTAGFAPWRLVAARSSHRNERNESMAHLFAVFSFIGLGVVELLILAAIGLVACFVIITLATIRRKK